MAEFIFKDMVQKAGLAERFRIASAATSREELGNDMYPPAKAILREHGVPFSRRGARQVTARDYDDYDWLILMDNFDAAYADIVLGCTAFFDHLKQTGDLA